MVGKASKAASPSSLWRERMQWQHVKAERGCRRSSEQVWQRARPWEKAWGRGGEPLPSTSPASLSTLSLSLEQGCLRSPAAPRFQTPGVDGLASVVGEQISNSGGSLHSLFAFGAKRNHMTFFKWSSLSAAWWNFNSFFLSEPQKKKVPTTRSKIPKPELSRNGGKE